MSVTQMSSPVEMESALMTMKCVMVSVTALMEKMRIMDVVRV